MIVIAVDYGDARTGVSVSDRTGTLAGRSVTIKVKSKESLADEIYRIYVEEKAEKLVLGLPRNMDGTEGPRTERTRMFGDLLEEKLGNPIFYWDERGSSVSAGRILSDAGKKRGKQRAVVDAVAAAIILQNYLDSTKK